MNIHCYYFPGQIVFITQIVKDRLKVFADSESVSLLRNVLRNVNDYHQFSMLGYVFMPDHFHLLFRPTGTSNFSQIMHSVKRNFTKAYKEKIRIKKNFNLWQARFWDHVIRDEVDFVNHLHYMHYNPVKHGYVRDPIDWQFSSFHLWQMRGLYEEDHGWKEHKNSSWGE